MRMKEWILVLIIAGAGMTLANFVGFGVEFAESVPGVIILLLISVVAVLISKIVPLQLPVIAYCSIIGLLLACPISPVKDFVIDAANKINFTAPITMVGAFAGLSISDQIRDFVKQGWKMILIGIFVMTGTFIGSACIAQLVLTLTNAI